MKWSVSQSKTLMPRRCMLRRWMYGHTKSDKIRSEDIRDKVEVASVVKNMREARLRWFRHVKRRCVDALVRRCERQIKRLLDSWTEHQGFENIVEEL
ncbi:hypothetical protein H5410_025094 [Solanum commersonii]|uniref:Uncharacterized protein n=1 Tax=Solanum commersonii TaxID=4109 RepID=A0A9J5YT97_SOLCO|nr:hypothetical protein H5410_025094 [Solanum commersonii]